MRIARSGMTAMLALVAGVSMIASCGDADERRSRNAGTATVPVSPATPERTARPVQVSDPANTLPGEFNADAAQQLLAYGELPILWLGDHFQDFQFVAFLPEVTALPAALPWSGGRTRANTAGLVYGTCKPRTVTSEMSCPPPLSIVVQGPGVSPPVDQMELHADWSTRYTMRGVPAIDAGTGTILFFDNGVTITVHSDSDIRQQALNALQLANAPAIGLKDIGPGEDLSPLNKVTAPVPPAECAVEQSSHDDPTFGIGFEPLCVSWADRFSDESGFLVRLAYLRSGDVFEHTVPANETSYTWPRVEQPNLEDPDSCADRGTIQIDVFAMIGDTLTPIDGMSANAECPVAK